jgi:hypothetical protein
MLFREIVAAYFLNHMKHVNTCYEQNVEFIVEAGGTYSNHCALKC